MFTLNCKKSIHSAALCAFFLNMLVITLMVCAVSCKKDKKKEIVDPHANEDEIVRINARQQVEYPDAIKISDKTFYLPVASNPSGKPVGNAKWVYLDYTTCSFDDRFVGSSVSDSAKLYRQWKRGIRYVPAFKENTAESMGQDFHAVLQNCHEGDKLIIGMSAEAGNATGMWKSNANESVIASVTILRAVDNPEAEEQKEIDSFLTTHPGFEKFDSVYVKVNEVGNGSTITEEGRVHLKYGTYFLDGSIIETNDEAIAARYNISLPSNQTTLLSIQVKNDPNFISGLSGVCAGKTIGTKLEIITPSSSAYKKKGKGFVRPYEPLRFEITIVNHIAL